MLFFKKKPKPEAGEEAAETPAPAEGAEGEEGVPPKKKLPILIIAIAAGVILLGGGGAGAWFFVLAPKAPADAAKEKPKKKEKKEGDKKDAKGAGQVREGPDGVTFYTLPDLTANLQSAEGKPSFLKLKLTFEMKDAATADALEEQAPRMKDMFTAFLRELRPEDLNGSQASFQLRMEILRRANLILAPSKIDAVDIEEMLIQ